MKLRRKLAALVGSAALMVGLLATASGAFATSTGTFYWGGQGSDATGCDAEQPGAMHWVFTGKGVSDVMFFYPGGPQGGANMDDHGNGSWYTNPDIDFFTLPAPGDHTVYVTYSGTLVGHAVLTLSHCGEGTTPQTSSIASEIHDGAEEGEVNVVVDNDNPAAMPATVHDTAWVTFDSPPDALPAGSSISFLFFENNDCTGDGTPASDAIDVSGFDSGDKVSSDAVGPLGAGSYSFQAFFTSGDTDVIDSAAGDCEPFKVRDFTGSELGETDVPSEPNTATLPTSGNSGPSDSSWLLVAALGVLLASVVVMTPSRAKNRR